MKKEIQQPATIQKTILENIDTTLKYNQKVVISKGFYKNYIGRVKSVNMIDLSAILIVNIDKKDQEVKVNIEDLKELGMFDFRK